MTDVVGSDIPTGDGFKWYYGGAEALLIEEDLVVDASGYITLTANAEFGSVFVVDSSDDPTASMLELQDGAESFAAATEATGTAVVEVHTDASGNTVTAYYLDTDTTDLVQIMGCKDVDTTRGIDVKETEISGQANKAQKTGSSSRKATLGKVTYNETFIAAIYGDSHLNSPASGQSKWFDKLTGTKKIAAMVGTEIVSGSITRKYFLMGCQVTSLGDSFPAADFYSESMDFLVDYMIRVKL